VLFTSEGSDEAPDDDLQFMSDGVIDLNLSAKERTLSVTKFRGSPTQGGHHSIRLTQTGIEVFPHLEPDRYKQEFVAEVIPSVYRNWTNCWADSARYDHNHQRPKWCG